MGIWAGIDVAKEVHWATAVDDRGQVVLDRRVGNDPTQLAELAEQLHGLDGELVVGLDVVGGMPAWPRRCCARPGCGWSMCLGWPSTAPAWPPAAGRTRATPATPG